MPKSKIDIFKKRRFKKRKVEWVDLENTASINPEELDNPEYYEDESGYEEEEYYEDESGYEEEEYYEDESGYEEEEYYEDEPGYEEEEYYEDESGYEEEGYYEDEPGYEEEEYYEDESGYEEEEYYEDEPGYEEEEYYEDESEYEEEEYYEDEAGYEKGRNRREGGIKELWQSFIAFFMSRSTTDLVMIIGGLLIALILIVSSVIFFKSEYAGSMNSKKEASAGDQAASDEEENLEEEEAFDDSASENDQMSEESVFEEENKEPEEVATISPEETENTEEKRTVVIMNLTSIKRDLKIKFVNNETKNLVTGVDFEISITDPKGNKSVKNNSSKDGVIYLTDLTPGQYQVALTGPADESLNYLTDPVSIKVKDVIEYKKVDVSAEIKKESEVNISKEDTAKNDTVEESSLKDTVAYVDSSKTEVEKKEETEDSKKEDDKKDAEYIEVSKDDIADPGASAMAKTGSRQFEPVDVMFGVEFIDLDATPTPEDGDKSDTKTPEATNTPESQPTPTENPQSSQTPSATPAATTENGMSDISISDLFYINEIGENETVKPSASNSPSASASVSPTASVSPSASPNSSATPTQSPTADPKTDNSSTLKTRSGEVLYVKDKDGYREAKFADYYTFDKFYKKAQVESSKEVKYTGWQHIDGATYYYDENGNYVTGEQVIQGASYKFGSDGKLDTSSGVMGIDVSKWNGSIDWSKVAQSGVDYVIIRCGLRGSSEGALIEDSMFKTNINGAKGAGLKVGVYFFTQAVNEVEAVEEASMVLELISGYSLEYPVFLDVEKSGGRADKIDTATRTLVCEAFCKTIANSGYKAGIYANKDWLGLKIDVSSLAGYKIWMAQYAATPTYSKSRYDIWQYSSKGTISGIPEKTDMNISYLGY